MVRFVVGIVALVLALVTHALALAWFIIGTCAVSDVADRYPAPASPQGLLCDGRDHWLNVLPYVVLGASVVLAVVLAATLWGSGWWRWVGLTACLWLPVVVSVGLAAPGDSCSERQSRQLPAYACRTVPDG